MLTFLLFIAALVGLVVLLAGLENTNLSMIVIGAFVCLVCGINWWDRMNAPPPPPTPQEIAAKEKRDQEIEAAKVPKLFSEADGCKVYVFEDRGYKHYFTKCGNETVSTDAARSVRSGKSTKTVIETIKTN